LMPIRVTLENILLIYIATMIISHILDISIL